MPAGAVARIGVPRLRAPEDMTAIAFTPDQRTFVIVFEAQAKDQPNVILFDAATGLERKRLPVRNARHVAMARAKPLMALDTDKGLEIWDLDKEHCVQRAPFPKPNRGAKALAIAPDGSQVVAAVQEDDYKAFLMRWDVAAGKALPTLHPEAGYIHTLSFAADGKTFLTSHWPERKADLDKSKTFVSSVIAWDARDGARLAEFESEHESAIFSPDGALMARSLAEETVEIIDLKSRKRIAAIDITKTGCAFTPDSKQLLILSYDQPMRLWDFTARKVVRVFEGKTWAVNMQPQFTPDGRFLAVRRYLYHQPDIVEFWDVASGKKIRYNTGHPGTVTGLAFAPDGQRIATISQDIIMISDARTGAELQRWIGHKQSVEHIAYAPDGTLVSASADGTIAFWDPATAKLKRRLEARDAVRAIAFSRDGATLFAVSLGQWIQCIDVATGKERSAFMGREKMVRPLFSGTQLAHQLRDKDYGDRHDPAVILLNPRTGKARPTLDLDRGPRVRKNLNARTVLAAMAFSPDGKLLATGDSLVGFGKPTPGPFDHTIRVWETATHAEVLRLTGNPSVPYILAFSPDGRTLAHPVQQGDDARPAIILRDISTAQNDHLNTTDDDAPGAVKPAIWLNWTEEYRLIRGQRDKIACMAFSPDGKFLATGGDQIVYVWRVDDFLKRWQPRAVETDVAELWRQLGAANAGAAYRAIAQMQTRPAAALALLRKHLRPVADADEEAIRRQVRALASANFATRQQAYAALDAIGERAEPFLTEALKAPHGLEMKRRLEALLDKLDGRLEDAEQLRRYRELTLLERIGTPEARKLLEELAQGAPAAWLTVEARHSLERLPPKE